MPFGFRRTVAPPPLRIAMASSAAPELFADQRVLVIDDQDHVRRWARRVLTGMGFEHIAEAEDGRAALGLVTAPGAAFDLILCDLKMPNTDGIELIRAFAAMRLDTAVVLLSMEPERVLETSALLAQEQGLRVLGALAKPLTADKLQPLLTADANAMSAAPGAAAIDRDALRPALQGGSLYLLYQPKIAMQSGRVVGVEALARWKHPELGEAMPEVFVPLCEESDALARWLLDYVVTEALAFARRASEGGLDLNVAINVHPGAFDDIALPDRLAGVVAAAGVPPERLTLEITERSVASDAVRMLDVAARLRLKGFNLAIDDFGTGHSGLAQLRRLPFNQLKIDHQFVNGSAESATKRSVVEASVALARNLHMTSVAEGVQRRPEWDLLQALGCEEMQGFFTGRPMTEEGFAAWAAQWNLNAFGRGIAS